MSSEEVSGEAHELPAWNATYGGTFGEISSSKAEQKDKTALAKLGKQQVLKVSCLVCHQSYHSSETLHRDALVIYQFSVSAAQSSLLGRQYSRREKPHPRSRFSAY